MKTVLLASTSPRRSQLLQQVGVAFTTVAPPYEEDMTLPMAVGDLAMHLAMGKAQSVVPQAAKHHVVVAADTFIEFEGKVIGKPGTAESAVKTLQLLRGKTNIVQTGYAVIDMETGEEVSNVVSSRIEMRDYSDDDIERYVATGEPLDKAGAYAINGIGAIMIERAIDADFSAVVGLPLGPVVECLRRFGISVL
jgi:septum formation protein